MKKFYKNIWPEESHTENPTKICFSQILEESFFFFMTSFQGILMTDID